MKKIYITILLCFGFLFAQSGLGITDGQVKSQNEVIDNLSYGGDSFLNIASGTVSGVSHVNKFGRAPAGVQDVITDIWDRADASPTQSIWLAPTAARVHAVVSGSANDAAAAGILTLTGNIDDTKTITIGSKVYTFQATLTNVDGNVHIGGSASATIDNLIDAINLGAGAGTDYAAAMTANEVTTLATVEGGDLMNIYMDTADGTLVTEDTEGADATWGAATIVLGVGARTIQIFGLTSWDSAETSEIMYLQGVFPQNTDNSYVIIHRMAVLTKGATAVNSGAIKATAASDATITAVILAGQGQTQMAIYGVPSSQTAYMTEYYGAFNKAGGATVYVDISLVVNPEPQDEPVNFLVKSTLGLQSNGTSYVNHSFAPYFVIPGPAIIKVQGLGSADDLDTSAGFDLILIDN